ncbi:MAG: hypothetical protein IIB28_00500, partial [Chloroflexi bacterium]|nr:hypothetical protein [Chloroflexota bacterium]
MISSKERKAILDNARAAHQVVLTERRRLKNLLATLDPNDPNQAADIHKIRNNLAVLDKQAVTIADAIGPGKDGKGNILSNPGAFSALGAADQASREFNPTPKAVAAAAGQATGTAAAAAGPGKAVAAGQKKAQELKAVSDFMQDTLRKAGLAPEVAEAQANDPVVTEAVQNPVEGGEPVSDDMREYTRRIALARAFGAVGLTDKARLELSLAAAILENSPDIQAEKARNKTASAAMVQLAGGRIGDTVGELQDKMDAAGRNVPTVREQARDRSLGTKSVKAEEMVSFVDEADIIIR